MSTVINNIAKNDAVKMLLSDTIRIMRNNATTLVILGRPDLAHEIRVSIMDVENLVDLNEGDCLPLPTASMDNLPPVLIGDRYFSVT